MNGNTRLTRTVWAALFGTELFVASASAQTYDVLKALDGEGGSAHAGLVQGTDGELYGTTAYGGAFGLGMVFKVDINGATFRTLHSFSGGDGATPYAALVQAADGNLYGTTLYGGTDSCTYGCGTIFKIDTNGSTFTTLHSFAGSDGQYPQAGLIQGTDGSLYGTTSTGSPSYNGTIFKIQTNGSTFTTLHSFAGSDGAGPQADLIQDTDGKLYGTTPYGGPNGYGTIFKTDTTGTMFTTLHSFAGTDGRNAFGGLIQGTDVNLYGTTYGGGANDYGTIFKIDTSGATFTTLHSFNLYYDDGAYPFAGLIQGTDGNLYGTTNGGTSSSGTVFKIHTNGSTFTTLHSFVGSEGANPYAGLIQGTDGNLYGTTLEGGASYRGTVFKIDTNGSTFTALNSFVNNEGTFPFAALIQGTDGNLYGTTQSAGASVYGTIFKIDTNGSTFTTLHSFTLSDGASPRAGLIQGTDGNLYGTTSLGGPSYGGTIFKIDGSGTTFTTLHSFSGSDGMNPQGGLIQGADGNLYGTTSGGGLSDAGTIFRIDTNGSTLATLHNFVRSDGSLPQAGLIQGADGNLYGTTVLGGNAGGYGTIFKIHKDGTSFATLHSFAGGDGAFVFAGLVQGSDGNLYGTTTDGGVGSCMDGCGTVFKIDTSGATFTTLHSFTGSDGTNPYGRLIQAKDGNLYGTTFNGGASVGGTIFKIDTNGTTLTTLHGFTGIDGANPYAGLIQGADGSLYGTAVDGGIATGGVVFRALGCFNDVPLTDPFHAFICIVARDGITAGCGGGNYCPDDPVTRAQMAVFLLEGEHGSGYTPTGCSGLFADVPCPGGFAVDWIERLSIEGITAGCGGGNYCPNDPVTRAQMAVFLLRAEHGPSYAPPTCNPPGIFSDVACPGGFAVDWIEQLYMEGVTGGCSSSPLRYCPDSPNTRGQMAVFLTKTFGLQ